jgi:hypothetical protein
VDELSPFRRSYMSTAAPAAPAATSQNDATKAGGGPPPAGPNKRQVRREDLAVARALLRYMDVKQITTFPELFNKVSMIDADGAIYRGIMMAIQIIDKNKIADPAMEFAIVILKLLDEEYMNGNEIAALVKELNMSPKFFNELLADGIRKLMKLADEIPLQ